MIENSINIGERIEMNAVLSCCNSLKCGVLNTFFNKKSLFYKYLLLPLHIQNIVAFWMKR